MRRREFFIIGGMVTGGAAGWPLASRAQQAGKVARIGFLGSATAAGSAKSVDALRTGLRDLGYMEGKNIVVEFQWAEGNYERLPALVAELIHRNVDIIITHGTPGTRAAKQATTTILIVMAISGDALATGLVASLARPEANLTGSTFFLSELNAKRLELLKDLFPHLARVAALSNPDNPVSKPIIPAMMAAAAPLKIELELANVQGPSEFDGAFATMAKSYINAVVVTEDGEFAAKDCRACSRKQASFDRVQGIRGSWRPDRLRSEPSRAVSPCGLFRRLASQGHQARRSSSGAARLSMAAKPARVSIASAPLTAAS